MINPTLFESFVTNKTIGVVEPFIEKFRGDRDSNDTVTNRKHGKKLRNPSRRRLAKAVSDEAESLSFNPYPLMGAPYSPSWPRGLPLDDIKKSQSRRYSLSRSLTIELEHVGVVQSLAQNDPDVDAMYRLTQPVPFRYVLMNTSSLVFTQN